MTSSHINVRHHILQTAKQITQNFISSIEWPHRISNVLSTVIQNFLDEEDMDAILHIGRYRSDVINRIDFALHQQAMKMADEDEEDEFSPLAYKTMWDEAIVLLDFQIKNRILISKIESKRQKKQDFMLHIMDEIAEGDIEAAETSKLEPGMSLLLDRAEPNKQNNSKSEKASTKSRGVIRKRQGTINDPTKKQRPAVASESAVSISEVGDTAPVKRQRNAKALISKA